MHLGHLESAVCGLSRTLLGWEPLVSLQVSLPSFDDGGRRDLLLRDNGLYNSQHGKQHTQVIAIESIAQSSKAPMC